MMSSAAAEKRVPPLPQDLQYDGGGGRRPEKAAADGLYAQLEQKEKDLTLAAELGNVLLEKNEELRRQNDALQREFSENVEVRLTDTVCGRNDDTEMSSKGTKVAFARIRTRRQKGHCLHPFFESNCKCMTSTDFFGATKNAAVFAAKDMGNPVALLAQKETQTK